MHSFTTDFYGEPAYPRTGWTGPTTIPAILGQGAVRAIAREIARQFIADAQASPIPVVWVTGNSHMPPLRSVTAAERVWQAPNNDDGELFALLCELIEDHLGMAGVILESPEYDNSLYVVDTRRWQYRKDADGDDLNDEWEPVDPGAVDDEAENSRELPGRARSQRRFTRGPEPAAMTDR